MSLKINARNDKNFVGVYGKVFTKKVEIAAIHYAIANYTKKEEDIKNYKDIKNELIYWKKNNTAFPLRIWKTAEEFVTHCIKEYYINYIQ